MSQELSIYSLPAAIQSIPLSQGYNDWRHKLYLNSNEEKSQENVRILAKKILPSHKDTVIGTSGLHTLNIAAFRGIENSSTSGEIKYIIIFDRSRRTEHFWQEAEKIITFAQDRFQAMEYITQLVLNNAEFYFSGNKSCDSPAIQAKGAVYHLEFDYHHGHSCFSQEKTFRRIQDIFRKKNFFFLRIDVQDTAAFSALAKCINKFQLHVDTLYVSNIAEFVEETKNGLRKFQESMKGLIQNNTYIIDTKERPEGLLSNKHPLQRIRQITMKEEAKAPVEEIFKGSPKEIESSINKAPQNALGMLNFK